MLTKYGLPQIIIFPVHIAALMAIIFIFQPLGMVFVIIAEPVLFMVLIWTMMFFRNPPRKISLDENVLLSPADGTITDISETEHPDIDGKALRIGMFLSIFNVHLNRMPCSARVESTHYRKGRFKNAMSADSGRVNESNEVLMTRLVEPKDRLIVRQVSGAIARHIVCKAEPGKDYTQGYAFGMIKFGSRTELYLPLRDGSYDIVIKIGDRVNAGLSPLIVYKK